MRQTHIFIKVIIILILSMMSIKGRAQTPRCIFYLMDTSKKYVTPEISTIKSPMVNPYALLSSRGIIVKCRFYIDSTTDGWPMTRSFDYMFKRGEQILHAGSVKSFYWDSIMTRYIREAEEADSLIIDNIKVNLNTKDGLIDLNKRTDIYFSDIRIQFQSAVKRLSEDEVRFDKMIRNLPAFRKLSDSYGSKGSIDKSVFSYGFEHNPSQKTIEKRFQFTFGERIDYDFTFIQDKRGHIEKVYDHVHKKEYTLKQWENRMKKVKL